MAGKSKITIAEVAHAAGVSTATVSRVLSGAGGITDELKGRVLVQVERLGYTLKEKHARRARPGMLAILTRDVVDAFFTQVIAGILDQTGDQDFLTTVICTGDSHPRQMAIIKQLGQYGLVGIIAAGVYLQAEEWIEIQQSLNAPVVVMNTLVNHPKIASIAVDFEGAARRAVQYLLDLGHTRIAYLGNYEYEFSAAELNGVKTALAQAGMPYPEEYRFSVPHTPEGASQGISRMMMLPSARRPTAILAFDDELAIHTLSSLRYYGLRVPEDMSLVGFDNIPMAAHTYPPLTTVDVPKYRIGRQAVLLLNKLLDNEGDGLGYTVINCSLLVRGSTGPASKP